MERAVCSDQIMVMANDSRVHILKSKCILFTCVLYSFYSRNRVKFYRFLLKATNILLPKFGFAHPASLLQCLWEMLKKHQQSFYNIIWYKSDAQYPGRSHYFDIATSLKVQCQKIKPPRNSILICISFFGRIFGCSVRFLSNIEKDHIFIFVVIFLLVTFPL